MRIGPAAGFPSSARQMRLLRPRRSVALHVHIVRLRGTAGLSSSAMFGDVGCHWWLVQQGRCGGCGHDGAWPSRLFRKARTAGATGGLPSSVMFGDVGCHWWLAQQCKAGAPVAATTELGPPDSLETRAGRAQVSLQQPICTRFPAALVQAADEHFAQGGQIGYPTPGQCLLELGQGVQQALDHFRAT